LQISLIDGCGTDRILIEVAEYLVQRQKVITPIQRDAVTCQTRNDRSAVEFIMYCLKFSYNLGRMMRRGLENVRNEMMKKNPGL